MNGKLSRRIALLALCLALAPAASPSAAPAGAQEITVRGKVAVTDSAGTRVTAATLTTAEARVYSIDMDLVGEDLAKVMFGQTVAIRGVVVSREGGDSLRVTGFADEKHEAAHELWRRSRCNACAVQKGAQFSAEPRDLAGAKAVSGRLYPYRNRVVSSARDARSLWLATDSLLRRIDFDGPLAARVYDRAAGFPDAPLLEIGSDGRTVWLIFRGSAMALPTEAAEARPLPCRPFAFARLCVTPAATWVIADNATWRFTAPDRPPEEFPAIPTGARMAAEIRRGLWFPFWARNTAYYAARPLDLAGRLYLASFGDVYELRGGAWRRAVAGASDLAAAGNRVWTIGAEGIVEIDAATGTTRAHSPAILDGRPTGLAATGDSLWVTADAAGAPAAGQAASGGLARFDLSTGAWTEWRAIDGFDATHAEIGADDDGDVWAVTRQGRYTTLTAHPGMTYVKKDSFEAQGFALHHWGGAAAGWKTVPLAAATLARRYLCGQDGAGADGDIGPQAIGRLRVAADRLFGVAQLVPSGNFSGYWTCVEQVASRTPGGAWVGGFVHRPDALGLQGEQPLVLNISNKGEMILEAVGHDDVLDFFVRNGTAWAVTEGGAGWFDAAAAAWRRTEELAPLFYWRATALLDEGDTVFIGADRGTVSRLDLRTGRCEIVGGLRGRGIARLARRDGLLVAVGGPAPMGRLPTGLSDAAFLDADAAAWDGSAWRAASADGLPEAAPAEWEFRPKSGADQGRGAFMREQNVGNMLWGPGPGGRAPRYYIKEVFMPRFLGLGDGGRRMWLSTFAGVVKIDLEAAPRGASPSVDAGAMAP